MFIDFNTTEAKQIKVTRKVQEFTQVPAWLFSGQTCPICLWGFYESPMPRIVTAVLAGSGNNRVIVVHNDCFTKATRATEK